MSRAENREQKEIPRPVPVRTPATMGTPAETGSQPRGTNAASCARRPDGTRARIRIPAGLRGQDGEIGQKEPRGAAGREPWAGPSLASGRINTSWGVEAGLGKPTSLSRSWCRIL